MTVVGKSSDLLARLEVQFVLQDLVNSPIAEIKGLNNVSDGNCLVSQDLLADPLDVVFRTNFLLFCLSFPGVWERMIRKLSQGLQV